MFEKAQLRLGLVFAEEDMQRVWVMYTEGDEKAEVQVDLHGLGCKASERLVNNVIAMFPQAHFSLVLIHGYNRGHALKDLFNEQFAHPRVVHTIPHTDNPGRTTLEIV